MDLPLADDILLFAASNPEAAQLSVFKQIHWAMISKTLVQYALLVPFLPIGDTSGKTQNHASINFTKSSVCSKCVPVPGAMPIHDCMPCHVQTFCTKEFHDVCLQICNGYKFLSILPGAGARLSGQNCCNFMKETDTPNYVCETKRSS